MIIESISPELPIRDVIKEFNLIPQTDGPKDAEVIHGKTLA